MSAPRVGRRPPLTGERRLRAVRQPPAPSPSAHLCRGEVEPGRIQYNRIAPAMRRKGATHARLSRSARQEDDERPRRVSVPPGHCVCDAGIAPNDRAGDVRSLAATTRARHGLPAVTAAGRDRRPSPAPLPATVCSTTGRAPASKVVCDAAQGARCALTPLDPRRDQRRSRPRSSLRPTGAARHRPLSTTRQERAALTRHATAVRPSRGERIATHARSASHVVSSRRA